MQYLFSGFKLDTEKKQLNYHSELVPLTKQNYQLLSYFVKNPAIIIDKNQLIENVWNGRIIADNSIDQSIYKLKKILTEQRNENYFETIYGHGTKFLPKVTMASIRENKGALSNKTTLNIIIIGILLISLMAFLLWNNSIKPSTTVLAKPVFVILPNSDVTNNEWLKNSPSIYVEKILSLSKAVTIKQYSDKPNNLNQQQYLETQWKLSPNLLVVTSDVSIQDNEFMVEFSIRNKQGEIKKRAFKSQQLNSAFKQALSWLHNQNNGAELQSSEATLIPENPYLMELYLHGLSAAKNKKRSQAIHYYELCLEENPDYHLAALELAKLKDSLGEPLKALSIIESINSSNTNPSIEIEAANIQGGILLRQGKPDDAKKLYTQLISKYTNQEYPSLLNTRYKLSLVYRSLSRNQDSLNELNIIEKNLKESQDYEFLAETYSTKASLLLRMGKTQQAIAYTNKATQLLVATGDLLGQAKNHSVTARIAIKQADYNKAIMHLKQALNITKSLHHKFGTGATLNEIISVLIAQGKINEAWLLNQELENIAVEIDFNAMLLAAKRYTIILAELKNQWQTASIYLQEHLELAIAANNKRAIIENTFLAISIDLKQNNLSKITNLIESIQQHIESSKEETLRPRLNLLRARYYYQTGKTSKAENLLTQSKIMAEATDDGQTIIDINNTLAKYYLDNNKPLKAQSVLQESANLSPVAYPYLLLTSKTNRQLNQLTKAIELASLCKLQANDLWSNDDEVYLTGLVTLKKSTK